MAIQFVIETGAGLSNSNSYATVAQANQYLENSGRKDVWSDFTNNQKQTSLVQAFFYMIARWEGQWLGQQTVKLQAGSWPQRGQFYPSQFAVGSNEIPPQVLNSQIEYAYAMLTAGLTTLAPDPTYDDTGRTVTSKTEKVDVLMEQTQYSEKGGSGRNVDAFRAYPMGDNLLKPFVSGGAVRELLRA